MTATQLTLIDGTIRCTWKFLFTLCYFHEIHRFHWGLKFFKDLFSLFTLISLDFVLKIVKNITDLSNNYLSDFINRTYQDYDENYLEIIRQIVI